MAVLVLAGCVHSDAKVGGRAQDGLTVIDGDTLDLDGERVRLWGIDAPEDAQTCQRDGRPWDCGEDAAAALAELVGDRFPECEERDRDRYGRVVAVCRAGDLDLGAEMVRQGWALDWPRYSAGAYAAEQIEAEAAQRGLWSGSFIAPWEWRRRKLDAGQTAGAASPDPAAKVNQNRTSPRGRSSVPTVGQIVG